MGRPTDSVQGWIFVQPNLKLPTDSVWDKYLSNQILKCPQILSSGEYLSNQILNCPQILFRGEFLSNQILNSPHILSLPDPGARSPHESEIPSTQCSRCPPSWLPHPARELYSRHSEESIWSNFVFLEHRPQACTRTGNTSAGLRQTFGPDFRGSPQKNFPHLPQQQQRILGREKWKKSD